MLSRRTGCHALRLFSPRSRPTRGFGGRLFRAGRFCVNRHCECLRRMLIFATSTASTRSSGRLLRAFYCSRRAGDWITRATRESSRAPGCGPLGRSVSAASRFAARPTTGSNWCSGQRKDFCYEHCDSGTDLLWRNDALSQRAGAYGRQLLRGAALHTEGRKVRRRHEDQLRVR